MRENPSSHEYFSSPFSLKLYFIRHAQKDDSGQLTNHGRVEANKYFGKVIRADVEEVDVFHSPIDRSRETAGWR